MTGMSEAEREVVRQRLAALNVDGWRLESAHGCDGTEEGCAATCPIQVQVRVSPDEIIHAVALDALASRDARLAAVEARIEDVIDATEWNDWPGRTRLVHRLRAALHSDPSEAR